MKAENINLAFNLETIYENAEFNINDIDKVGVVGVNGAGKTTLFKVILAEQELDSGRIIINNRKKVGYLPQEINLSDKDITVFDYIMSARPIDKLNKKLANLYEKVAVASSSESKRLLKQIAKTQDLLEYYDCYNAENIMLEIVSNMHIDSMLLDMKLVDLSGGQKSKVAFAHLIYSNPEIMLLDEPTNHLDVQTRSYVINYLKNYRGMVLIISHDTSFLDEIVNRILHIDKSSHKIKMYNGNYSNYLKQEKQERALKEKQIEKETKEIEALKNIVLKYSNSSGKRKRMAESREKVLNKKLASRTQQDKTLKTVKINLKPSREGSKIPIKVNNISFGYDKLLFKNLSFLVNNKERFLVVGENGVGKSTLLKLIIGALKPLEGNIWRGNKTDIAYYAQELEMLDDSKTILENVDMSGYSEKELRTVLGSFLFNGDDVFKKVKVLSLGEKARVALAKIMLQKANTLILDEPTNHLDPITQQIIGEIFKNYDGTIILVSHNPSFVETIGINRMLILPSGKITNYSHEKLNYYYELNEKNFS